MRRDPRLRDLSSDHHRALVIARRALEAPSPDAALPEELRRAFAAELEPHFRVEEERLLPALAAAGEAALVDRTHEEHRLLRDLAARLDRPGALAEFATHLKAHVRFEERELFPAAERRLDAATLDAIARGNN